MKLVNILARELKVWPEGNYFAWQDYDREIRFSHTTCRDFHTSILADDHVRSRHGDDPGYGVTRAEWQAAVDALNAPKVVEWDGKGNPPAGSTCQIRHSGWDDGSWQTADIKYISSEYLIIGYGDFKREQHFHMPDIQFRPILTAEQVAAEEREKAAVDLAFLITGHMDRSQDCAKTIGEIIHDAGYRKKVSK